MKACSPIEKVSLREDRERERTENTRVVCDNDSDGWVERTGVIHYVEDKRRHGTDEIDVLRKSVPQSQPFSSQSRKSLIFFARKG